MNHELLRELLHKYAAGELTPSEARQVAALINDPVNEAIMDEFVHEVMLSDSNPSAGSPVIKSNIDRFLDLHITAGTRERATIYSLFRRRWLSVAATILMVFTVGMLVMQPRDRGKADSDTAGVTQPPHDVAPPALDKAVLTLGDGRQIVIGDAATGSLSTDGNTDIVKLDDGRIVYKSKGESVSPRYNLLAVPRGSHAIALTLSDGSRVWLNSASTLRYPAAFTGSERVVEITGEAFFAISPDKTKPFIVKKAGGDTRISVLGTEFNVNAYDDESDIRITLFEGAVDVVDGTAEMSLRPGQQAVVTDDNMTLNTDPALEKIMSWKNNEFVFEYDDIETIMRQLARWYDIDVVIEKPSARKYIGRINRSVPLSRVLQMFEKVGYIKFHINGRTVTVVPVEN